MKYLSQFLLLMTFVLAGELIAFIIPLPIPSMIYGLLLLFGALCTGIVKLKHIEGISNWFLAVIPVLFVVPAVGIINIMPALAGIWPWMLAVIVLTYFAVMASTGYLSDIMIWLKDRRGVLHTLEKASTRKKLSGRKHCAPTKKRK